MSMQIVGYDLGKPRRYKVLDRVLGNAQKMRPGSFDGGINLPNGPRFVDAEETPQEVRDALVERLDRENQDRVMVAKIGRSWAGVNVPKPVEKFLDQRKGHALAAERDRRLGIAYTIRVPPGTSRKSALAIRKAEREASRRRRKMNRAIDALPQQGAATRPVNALRLIKTNLTPREAKDRLGRKLSMLGVQLSRDDELLIVEVDAATTAFH